MPEKLCPDGLTAALASRQETGVEASLGELLGVVMMMMAVMPCGIWPRLR